MNIASDLTESVSKVAPLLGSVLGGPLGGVVGTLIASVLGSKSSDPKDLLAIINGNSEAAVKLKQLELEYESELIKMRAQNYATEVDDRKDARALAKSNEWQTFALAVGYLSFYVIKCILEMLGYAKVNADLENTLTMIAVMIGSFYFGSSKGERYVMQNGK